MCRSIKQLRRPETPVSEEEVYEAALQYVRKISGYRKPSRSNTDVFEKAVQEVAFVTRQMLIGLEQPLSSIPAAKQD